MGSTSVAGVAASGVLVVASGVVRYSSLFSSEIAVSKKTTDIWRCANEDQCVPDKTGCSCPKTTRGVRLARQGCWCCACRSSSPVLQESYCRILSLVACSGPPAGSRRAARGTRTCETLLLEPYEQHSVVASLMSLTASLVTTSIMQRCFNVMCISCIYKVFSVPVSLLYSVGNKTCYYC